MKKFTLLLLVFTFFQNAYAQVKPRLIEKSAEIFNNDLNRYKLVRKELYDYDQYGNLSRFRNQNFTDEILTSWQTEEYEYDDRNNLIAEIRLLHDSSGIVLSHHGTFHEYNLQNNITKTSEKRYNSDVDLWIIKEWTDFTYDNDGCVMSKTNQENSVLTTEDISIYTTDENCRIIKEEYIPDPGFFSTFNYDLDNYGSYSKTKHKTFNNQIYPWSQHKYLYNEYGDQIEYSILTRSFFQDTTNFYAEESHYDYVVDPITNLITTKFLEEYTIDYPQEEEPRFRWSAEYNYEYNCDGSVKVEIRKDLNSFPPVRYQYAYERQLDCIDFEKDLIVTIFPNPSLGLIEIRSNFLTSGNTTLKIFSSDGKLVGEKLLLSGDLKQNINLNFLHNGFYLLQFQNGENVKTTKLIIAK